MKCICTISNNQYPSHWYYANCCNVYENANNNSFIYRHNDGLVIVYDIYIALKLKSFNKDIEHKTDLSSLTLENVETYILKILDNLEFL